MRIYCKLSNFSINMWYLPVKIPEGDPWILTFSFENLRLFAESLIFVTGRNITRNLFKLSQIFCFSCKMGLFWIQRTVTHQQRGFPRSSSRMASMSQEQRWFIVFAVLFSCIFLSFLSSAQCHLTSHGCLDNGTSLILPINLNRGESLSHTQQL